MSEAPTVHFICQFIEPKKWDCVALLSNGIIIGHTTCSHPGFAHLDLMDYATKAALGQVLGVTKFWSQPKQVTTLIEALHAHGEIVRRPKKQEKLDKLLEQLRSAKLKIEKSNGR